MVAGRAGFNSSKSLPNRQFQPNDSQQVLAMSDMFNSKGYRPAQLVDPAGMCTGCAVCALICPDTAITVYRQATQEPRTKNRESAGSVSGSQLALPVPALASTERRLS